VDGILVIDKPAGLTSHDVVNRVRRILKTKRVGHTGTLDPFATGVMVILVGKATRLAQFIDKDDKEYEAVIRFGFETDTGDKTGVRTAVCGSRIEEIAERLRNTDWTKVLQQFRGEFSQTPPMYSAKKVEGKKLYELARQGIEIERQPVLVNIYALDILDDAVRNFTSLVRIRVACSAGTYIRTLAEDIGRAIGTGAHLEELRRTASGRFTLNDATTIEDLMDQDKPASLLLPIRTAVASLPEFVLAADRAEKTKNGMSTRDLSGRFSRGELVQMIDENGELIAVGGFDGAEKVVQPKVVLG
jgi:tRNA pseudouridine55 synthase